MYFTKNNFYKCSCQTFARWLIQHFKPKKKWTMNQWTNEHYLSTFCVVGLGLLFHKRRDYWSEIFWVQFVGQTNNKHILMRNDQFMQVNDEILSIVLTSVQWEGSCKMKSKLPVQWSLSLFSVLEGCPILRQKLCMELYCIIST